MAEPEIASEPRSVPLASGDDSERRGAERLGDPFRAPRSRGIEKNGPTRIRTWNQAVMSPESGSSHGLAQRGAASFPLRESGVASERGTPRLRTISTVTTLRGAPVVRNLRLLLSVREVAELLSVSRATVYALIERGELERVWVVTAIRVSAASVDAYLRRSAR